METTGQEHVMQKKARMWGHIGEEEQEGLYEDRQIKEGKVFLSQN
jgi:hypothetical protein